MKKVYINSARCEKPKIALTAVRCEMAVWDMFKKHHYMTEAVNKGYKPIVYEWDGVPVAITIIGNKCHPAFPYRLGISRLVVLPDYQGMGIGHRICNFMGHVAESLSTPDMHVFMSIRTIHPGIGECLTNDPEWIGLKDEHTNQIEHSKKTSLRPRNAFRHIIGRPSYSKHFIGKPIYGFEKLLDTTPNLRKEKHGTKKQNRKR